MVYELIIDAIERLEQYLPQYEGLENLKHFLKAVDSDEVHAGRYELSRNGTYANVDCYCTKAQKDGRLECHRQYVDLQYVSRGNERIGITSLQNTELDGDFDSTADIGFRKGDVEQWVQLHKGMFAMIWPHEAHMPGITSCDECNVVKVVVKLPVSCLAPIEQP